MLATCAACGQPVASTAKFCAVCGQPAQRACAQCGGQISAQASFCGTCGANVVAAAPAPEALGATTMPPATTQAPAPIPAAPWAAPVAAIPPAPTSMRSARRPPVLLAGAAVAVVAVLVATTVFGARLPWSAASVPLVETPMVAPTVIDVASDDTTLAIVPGQENRLDTEGAALVIPAGAASPNTTVTVRVLQEPFNMTQGPMPQDGEASAAAVGPVVDFGPEGTTFSEPVTISVPYDHAFLPAGMSEDSIRAAYWNGQSWVVVSGLVDKNADTVSVKLSSFKGSAMLAVVTAAAIAAVGWAAKEVHDTWGELKWGDPVTAGTAKEYVTPDSTTVKEYASKAVITDAQTKVQMAVGDPRMPDWLAKANDDGHKTDLGYLDPTSGKVTPISYDLAKGSNWQHPDDFFNTGDVKGPLHGDCTDITNSSVSVLIASGFRAKGVFGRDVNDKDHGVHAWTEVSIGGKIYMMDESGIYSPDNWKTTGLPTYAADTWGRHYNAMFDDLGQKPYDKDWWLKTELRLVASQTGGTTYAFTASARTIPNTTRQVEFLWDFGDGSKDTDDVHTPSTDPLVSSKTHEVKVSPTVTVTLYDTTVAVPVELARAQVTVKIGSAAPSPSVLPSPSALVSPSVLPSTPAISSAGHWQFVEAKSYPNPIPVLPDVKDDWDVTADSAHYSETRAFPGEGAFTVAWSCNWTAAKKLEPGKIVEASVGCTDSSQYNSDGHGNGSGAGMAVYMGPTVASGHAGETQYSTLCLRLPETGYQKSGTATASCKVPAGPLASDPWNGRIALDFNLWAIGYTEWIYEWVPGGA